MDDLINKEGAIQQSECVAERRSRGATSLSLNQPHLSRLLRISNKSRLNLNNPELVDVSKDSQVAGRVLAVDRAHYS